MDCLYNWLFDRHNECYYPITKLLNGIEESYSYFYVLHNIINIFNPKQLIASGGVQFYRNSDVAKYLLCIWQKVITENPIYADDQLLSYTYNNFIVDKVNLSVFWLDKSYYRIAWWPHIKPVINHPDIPDCSSRPKIETIQGLPERDLSMDEIYPKKADELLFPLEYFLDTKYLVLYKFEKGKVVDKKPFTHPLWIG